MQRNKFCTYETGKFTFESSSDLSNFSKETWDYFTKDNFCNSSNYISALLKSKSSDIQPIFVAVKDGEEQVATLYFQVVKFKIAELNQFLSSDFSFIGKVKNILFGFAKAVFKLFNWNILISGNMFFTGDNGFSFAENISAHDRIKIVEDAVVFLKNDKNYNINAVLISDLNENENKKATELSEHGYTNFKVEPSMLFYPKEEWNNFEDYLAALKSKYRVRTKKVLKDSQSIQAFEINKSNIGTYEKEIFKLYKNIINNIGFKMAEIGENYFQSLVQLQNDCFQIIGYKDEKEKLVGFVSKVLNNRDLEIHLIGMDYQSIKNGKIYNRMLIDCIKSGIDIKAKRIIFGRTANEIKSTLGAIPQEMFCYCKHFNPLINLLLVKRLTPYFKPENWTPRNPFK